MAGNVSFAGPRLVFRAFGFRIDDFPIRALRAILRAVLRTILRTLLRVDVEPKPIFGLCDIEDPRLEILLAFEADRLTFDVIALFLDVDSSDGERDLFLGLESSIIGFDPVTCPSSDDGLAFESDEISVFWLIFFHAKLL